MNKIFKMLISFILMSVIGLVIINPHWSVFEIIIASLVYCVILEM